MSAFLIRRVEPIYPPEAKANRIQGKVVLQATIAKDGTVKNIRAVLGSPELIAASIDAVRQWRYKPYWLKGENVEVDTEITMTYRLAH